MEIAPKPLRARDYRGFTLVELLTVVTIIMILSGMVIGVTSYVNRKSAIDKARTQMETFNMKITEYQTDAGFLPETTEGDIEAQSGLIIYRMLYCDGVGADGIAGTADDGALDGRPDEGLVPYLADLDPNTNPRNLIDKKGTPLPVAVVDPWGNAWRFRNERGGPDQENPDFDLWSLGPDGKNGTSDDIRNW